MPTIDIILPCLDEADALPWVLDRIPLSARAIVVDNGSTDESASVARELGASVVPCTTRGYGAACAAGLAAATAEYVVVCDCDGTIDPHDALRAVDALRDADLVVARRVAVERAAFPLPARIANRVLARRVSRRIGQQLRDLGPLRAARRESLVELDVRDSRFGYPVETVLRAADAGWRIAELAINYRPRFGRSKVTGTLGGYTAAVRDISAVLAK